LVVDLHNGRHFDPRRWARDADVPTLILRALQLNEHGRIGNSSLLG
jgi:hypothetical protein